MILGGFRDIQDIQDFIETMLLVSANNRAIIRMKEAHGNMEINLNGSCTLPHLTFATSFCPLGLVGSGCGDLITCSPFMPCSWICRSQSQSRAIRRIDWAGRLKKIPATHLQVQLTPVTPHLTRQPTRQELRTAPPTKLLN